MDEDTLAQIVGQMVRVGRFYQMESLDDGRVIATKVRDIVDEYLETQQLPEEFEDEREILLWRLDAYMDMLQDHLFYFAYIN